MNAYKPGPYEIAGFDLYAERQDDGTLLIGFGEVKPRLTDFPAEVELLGATYTLEDVRKNSPGTIEWGVYA